MSEPRADRDPRAGNSRGVVDATGSRFNLSRLFRCRHRPAQLIKDARKYNREVTADGETIKTWERKECRCGVVIEHTTESTNINRTVVSSQATLQNREQ